MASEEARTPFHVPEGMPSKFHEPEELIFREDVDWAELALTFEDVAFDSKHFMEFVKLYTKDPVEFTEPTLEGRFPLAEDMMYVESPDWTTLYGFEAATGIDTLPFPLNNILVLFFLFLFPFVWYAVVVLEDMEADHNIAVWERMVRLATTEVVKQHLRTNPGMSKKSQKKKIEKRNKIGMRGRIYRIYHSGKTYGIFKSTKSRRSSRKNIQDPPVAIAAQVERLQPLEPIKYGVYTTSTKGNGGSAPSH